MELQGVGKGKKKKGNSKIQTGKMCKDIWHGRNIVYNRRVVQGKQVEYRGRWGTGVCL